MPLDPKRNSPLELFHAVPVESFFFKKRNTSVVSIGDKDRQTRWIGVDLNTTGHVAVAAEPFTGNVIRLGRTVPFLRQSSCKCTKLYREGKLWKLKRCKSRERKMFKTEINSISNQIVSFAEMHFSGIKLEKLFSDHYMAARLKENLSEFSFENGSFVALQRLVEKRAIARGIPVLYVDPANTSKRCSRCGGYGRRVRKRFECPFCGSVLHADVNAAFNIAVSSRSFSIPERDYCLSHDRKKVRRVLREQRSEADDSPPFLCVSLLTETISVPFD